MCSNVDLSSRFSEFLPESNRRSRDRKSRALTNKASFTLFRRKREGENRHRRRLGHIHPHTRTQTHTHTTRIAAKHSVRLYVCIVCKQRVHLMCVLFVRMCALYVCIQFLYVCIIRVNLCIVRVHWCTVCVHCMCAYSVCMYYV